MASLLYTLEGWLGSPSSDNNVRSYNNDSGVWTLNTGLAAPPFTGQTATQPNPPVARQQGGWDGSYWYVIGPDGKLYRYNPNANSWSAALAGGVVVVTGTITSQHWTMCSDGRFLYILSSSGDFVRYDPLADTLGTRPTLPGTGYSARMFLVYDGTGALYGYKGGTDYQVCKYSVSGNAWTLLPVVAGSVGTYFVGPFAVFLQGSLWVLYQDGNLTNRAYQYSPGGNTWTAKATGGSGNAFTSAFGAMPYGEDTDATIRIWPNGLGVASVIYNVGNDTWATAAATPWQAQQGCNWAINRKFSGSHTWYEADGTTLTENIDAVGTTTPGGTLTHQFRVTTALDRPGGVTVAVATDVASDADDPVNVCATAGGVYAKSFTTAALLAGQQFNVFVKVLPTANQTTGLAKTLNLTLS